MIELDERILIHSTGSHQFKNNLQKRQFLFKADIFLSGKDAEGQPEFFQYKKRVEVFIDAVDITFLPGRPRPVFVFVAQFFQSKAMVISRIPYSSFIIK